MIHPSTLLLVEDDPNDVVLMRRAFNRARLANPLEVVNDGEAAIGYLQAAVGATPQIIPPSIPLLVLLDLKLPRKSGFEVLQWIRTQEHLNPMPVVILTSSENQPDVVRAFEMGANSYLVKPAQFQDLIEMMLRLQGYWLLINRKADRMALMVEE